MQYVYLKDTIRVGLEYLLGRYYYNFTRYARNPDFPKKTARFCLKNRDATAILLQGPFVEIDNFTIGTLRLYRRFYPDVPIILSTWHCPDVFLSDIKNLGVHLIINDQPLYPGRANLNYQIVSTRTGILMAETLGATYVLKTRTDQRFCSSGLIDHLLTLISAFPLAVYDTPKQFQRIVAISKGTFKYRLYGVSDMFCFGHISDIKAYWDIPQDREGAARTGISHLTWRQQADLSVPEHYIVVNFMRSTGWARKNSLADYLDLLGRRYIIVDHEAVGLYWHKRTIDSVSNRDFRRLEMEVRFVDWLMYRNALSMLKVDERVLDEIISD